MPLVEFKDFSLDFEHPNTAPRAVIDDLNFSIPRATKMGLVGASGAGKTQIAYAIMGLLDDNHRVKGRIEYNKFDILNAPESVKRDIRGREISIIFQDSSTALNPHKRIGAQIMEAIRVHQKMSKSNARTRALELLDTVKLHNGAKILDQYPHELSGGMRQRISIAMALAGEPKLIVADEPTLGLDMTVQKQILDVLEEIHKTHEVSILLISHDLDVVSSFCEEVVVLFGGRIMEQGSALDVLTAPSHPYTRMMMKGAPLTPQKTGLSNDPAIADLSQYQETDEGCPFFPYCNERLEVCSEVVPRLTKYGRRRACLREIGAIS